MKSPAATVGPLHLFAFFRRAFYVPDVYYGPAIQALCWLVSMLFTSNLLYRHRTGSFRPLDRFMQTAGIT